MLFISGQSDESKGEMDNRLFGVEDHNLLNDKITVDKEYFLYDYIATSVVRIIG